MYYLIDKYAPFEEGAGPRRLVESERALLSDKRDHTRAYEVIAYTCSDS